MSDGKKLRSIDHGVSRGNAVEGVRLEHVDAGVDRVAGDLVGLRLLEEAADVALGVGFDQAVRCGLSTGVSTIVALALRSRCSAITAAEIDLRQDVAVEHDDRFAQRLAGVADGAGRAERRRLDDVSDAEADVAAVAEDLLDAPRLVVQAEDDLVDLGHLLQQIELVVQERPLEDRNDRLGRVDGQRAQSRALAPGQQDRLHRNVPLRHTAMAGTHDIMCVPAHMNLPNALIVTRIFLVPLLVVVLLTKFEGRIDFRRAEGAGRRGDLRRSRRSPTGSTATSRGAASRSRRSAR